MKNPPNFIFWSFGFLCGFYTFLNMLFSDHIKIFFLANDFPLFLQSRLSISCVKVIQTFDDYIGDWTSHSLVQMIFNSIFEFIGGKTNSIMNVLPILFGWCWRSFIQGRPGIYNYFSRQFFFLKVWLCIPCWTPWVCINFYVMILFVQFFSSFCPAYRFLGCSTNLHKYLVTCSINNHPPKENS